MKTVIYLMVVAFLIGTTPVMVHAHEDTESMSNEKTVAKKMEMLTTELGLSDKQAADIKVLITEKLTKLAEAKERRKVDELGELEAIKNEYSYKVKELLTVEQNAMYDVMKKGSSKDSMEDAGTK